MMTTFLIAGYVFSGFLVGVGVGSACSRSIHFREGYCRGIVDAERKQLKDGR